MKYDGILFDLDGTLWNATDNILKSWNIAIKDFDELSDKEISLEELKGVMGLPMDEIAARLFSSLNKEKQLQVLDRCCEIENEYLSKHGGILYPELVDTLKVLKKHAKLCIVSNGQAGYIQSFLNAHNLWEYFDDIQNWGDNKVVKGENIKIVIERNKIKNAVYVGDTQGDCDAAKLAGIDFIFAGYGFGQADNYVVELTEFKQLMDL